MWKKIVGHKKQIDQIKRAIKAGTTPHAYLFSGMDGIGKRLVAKAAAQALLCKKPAQNMDPCGKCESCLKLKNNTHVDLNEVVAEKNQITIDLIRNLKSQLRFSPIIDEKRIFIIDQAELMNPNAANAALKILEEPPPGNHFFLISSTPHRLLPTIVSRCQKMQFSPLGNDEIRDYLIKFHKYTKDDAELAAGISEGSIGRALTIKTELIEQVTEELCRLLNSNKVSDYLELSAKWSSEKADLDEILYILHRSFYTALIDSCQESPNMADTGEPAGIIKLARLIQTKNSRNKIREKCDLINKSHENITKTYNKQLMFESILFNLAA